MGLVPRAKNRLGENSDGALIADAVVQQYPFFEHLHLSQHWAKGYWEWSPMLLPHSDLSEALNQVPALSSRNRRVTQMTDFDAGWPRSVLINTSDGLEWGHPIIPYFH